MHACYAYGGTSLTYGDGATSQLLHALDTCSRTAPADVLHTMHRRVTRLGHTLTPFSPAQENRCAHIVVPLKSVVALEPSKHSLSEVVLSFVRGYWRR
jgi:hypothetical protein